MKAMVLAGFGPPAGRPLELRDVPVPAVGPEDILIKVRCCGVCHTDLHVAMKELSDAQLPLVPGHEVIGVVERAGERARRFAVGQRVGVAWLRSACGVCRFCLSGRENLCESARFNGYHADGGYAEYMAVGESFAYAVPERFGDAEAAPLMCAGIVGYRALRLSGLGPDGVLGLYGFGGSAHIAIQVARRRGARVFVFTRSARHQELARELGADWVGTAGDEPPARLTSAIIFAPAGHLYLEALRVLDRGGTVVSAGIHMTPIPEMDYDRYLYHERRMLSVANATRRDGEELLDIAAEIPVRTTVRTYPLEAANEALDDLASGRLDAAAVLKVGT
ncbi:MAG TPA: zinc-dependent alcohol dehydrogenase family protein [Candidatus Aminicenantes bacterium]|nr:zinc-dependent alcohol dehydrogenase family protein [Candidatus Aminicenantes bacterium]HRY65306.1 zinc-dependent alcohol dehydrogenase family protein [Candidatus Aminicenantes bacterium]HRZ72226.1 zinc-dependent alcohol dehydrogenase family protein [Candidatus Aminicenantes bacterium]